MSEMTPEFAIKVLAGTKVASNYDCGPTPRYGYQNQSYYDKARNLAIAAIKENKELKATLTAMQTEIAKLKIAKEVHFFVPSNEDWDNLLNIVGENYALLHWEEMYFWCSNIVDASYPAFCGYYWARHRNYILSKYRSPRIGFRPAFVPLDADTLKPGVLVRYALYLDGVEQPVPTNPTFNGDIKSYRSGQLIEIKESTRPETAITWYYNGQCYIADRALLNMVSYDNLKIGAGYNH